MQPAQPEESSGSGVIISDDGYIVTNNHVVENGDKIQVILYDKRSYDAKVIGTDQATDLALVKIDEKDLPFIRFGNSDSVEVGDWVLAVGNPFNLESTVTAGIVSAKGRNIGIIHTNDDKGNVSSAIESYIQTDAAVNPGNSGGALVNTYGELVGINSAIATPTGSFAGYSFAVPVNIVKKVIDDLAKYGMVQRGYLGITITSVDADLAKKKNLNQLKGVYVDSIYKGSAAAEAGLKTGDVITAINGTEVNSSSELQAQVSEYHPGDKITIAYLRGDKDYTSSATLKNKEGDVSYESKPAATDINQLGAEFSDLSSKDKHDLGIDGGVKVTKIDDGKLSQTEIREGFIITHVNNQPVKDVDDLKRLLASNSKGNGVLIEGRYPGDPTVYYYGIGM
jgi:serine protease Do